MIVYRHVWQFVNSYNRIVLCNCSVLDEQGITLLNCYVTNSQEVSTGVKSKIVLLNSSIEWMLLAFHYLDLTEGKRSDGLKRQQNFSRVIKASETEFSEILFAKSPLHPGEGSHTKWPGMPVEYRKF